MAIKASNQITFAEHKKIVEIKEWYLATPESDGVTNKSTGWTEEIQSLSYTNKYLWNYEEVVYSLGSSDISDPIIIGVYGGLQSKYISSATVPIITNNDVSAWSDTIPAQVSDQRIYMTQKISTETTWSTPIQISAEDGKTGVGISSIVNYYATTSTPDSVPLSWYPKVPTLTPTDKYLWNYEVVNYTNGVSTPTDPAIIGAYGDSGADAVDFQIYSTDGFEFSDNKQAITLKTVALKSGEVVNGTAYQWSWWNKDSEVYENISSATSSTIIIYDTSPYAFSDIKCTMTYNGNPYEDHVTLTEKTVVYTSIVKFFDGNNIFHDNDQFLVAYVELYQNNKKIDDGNKVDKYYSSVVTVSSGIIAGVTGSFSDGDKMYFVYKENNLYKVVLGQYSSGTWRAVDTQQNYTYTNSLYPSIKSNIIAISKESVNKSANIDFIIFKGNEEISRTSANVIDSNDPIISPTRPSNAVHGQLWLDTSQTPYVLWMHEKPNANDAGKWVECSEKIGGAVFTSQPNRYFAGDVWILGANESCGSFGPGSMLKAIVDSSSYSESHWVDADASSTELKNNINQYFKFNPSTGLKIGQQDQKFYVNISSTEMGFYDNSKGQNEKVVSISNNSAAIQSAQLKGNTDFYGQLNICDPKSNPSDSVADALFIWKVEQDGSLSLSIA